MVDKLTKWGYFILCTEEILAKDLLKIYIKEMFTKHKALIKIILNKDLRFMSAFWKTFIAKQRAQIIILTIYHL